MLANFVRLAILAAVCCDTTSLHEAEQLQRNKSDTDMIQRRWVLVENLNIEIYTSPVGASKHQQVDSGDLCDRSLLW